MRTVFSHGIMQRNTVTAMLENIRRELKPGDGIVFAFQGGEPTLAGLDWFLYFAQIVSTWDPGIHVAYSLQTNGILLDEDWCRFLKRYNFLVGLSMDLLPREHNESRVYPSGEGSWKQVCHALSLLRQHQVEFNVLCTLTNRIARHPQEVWKQIIRLDLQYVQFTPCLADLDATQHSPYALEPKRFASFYKTMFPLWFCDFRKGKYRSIKLFDDLVNLLAFGRVAACGMTGKCSAQIIVEADGSVYPCDFYCLDKFCLGNIAQAPLSVLLHSPVAREFLTEAHPQPVLCSSCHFRELCGGNCRRMQSNICCTADNTFCGYQDFLNSCYSHIASIALQQRSLRP